MPAPLADRLRPETLDDLVGQPHLLGKDKALRRIIESGQIPNLIFYGPEGPTVNFVSSTVPPLLPPISVRLSPVLIRLKP